MEVSLSKSPVEQFRIWGQAVNMILVIRIFYRKKAATKTKILPNAVKINFPMRFQLEFSIEKGSRQNQDLAKRCKNKISNMFPIIILIEKSNRQNQEPPRSYKKTFNSFSIRMLIEQKKQNQDPARSCKKQFFNTFSIRISIEKSSNQNQDPARSWKNQVNFPSSMQTKPIKFANKPFNICRRPG